MASWISTKKSTAMGLDMPHLVWKFYEKSCFSFLDMARKRKKWTKNNNNNNKKELDQNQESSPLLRWSLITSGEEEDFTLQLSMLEDHVRRRLVDTGVTTYIWLGLFRRSVWEAELRYSVFLTICLYYDKWNHSACLCLAVTLLIHTMVQH